MACGGVLSAMMMVAGSGLLQNAGLAVSPTMSANISALTSVNPIGTITSVLGKAAGQLGGSALSALKNLGVNIFPSLANTVPTTFQGAIFPSSLTSGLTSQSSSIFGSDLGQFAQHFNAANAFTASSNSFISTVQNIHMGGSTGTGLSGIPSFFSSVDNLITGSITDITKALPSFSTDLLKSGNILKFDDLSNLGNPLKLLQTYAQVSGGMPVISNALTARGIDPGRLLNILTTPGVNVGAMGNMKVSDFMSDMGAISVDPFNGLPYSTENDAFGDAQRIMTGGSNGIYSGTGEMTIGSSTDPTSFGSNQIAGQIGTGISGIPTPSGLGNAIYEAFGDIKDDNLALVQRMLGSDIPNLSSMQDLLNPKKILPNSANTITSYDSSGTLKGIYI